MLEESLGVVYNNSDQQKTCMKASINLDHSNRVNVYEMLKSSPFADNPALWNTINRITADKKVNVDKFIETGPEIIGKMARHDIF